MVLLRRMVVFIFGGQLAVLLMLTMFYSYGKLYHGLGAVMWYSENPQEVTKTPETGETEGTSTRDGPCKPIKHVLPESTTLCDSTRRYFVRIGGLECFIRGTDLKATKTTPSSESCVCKEGYYGQDCGIPEAAWKSCLEHRCFGESLKRRSQPRRIIHGLNVNHEIDFFEVRLREIGDVVDVFIVGESNYTAGGDPKPIRLLPKLKDGFLQEFHHKIVHVIQDHFPDKGLIDGWYADTYLRDFMGRQGLKRIQGIRDDDLFLLLDADEIPTKEVLLFLKLYDGYPEPIALAFRWTVYGFFWRKRKEGEVGRVEDATRVVAVCSMKMLRQVYDDDVMSLRRNHVDEQPVADKITQYAARGNPVLQWTIGTEGSFAGHHCSWCFRPEGIRTKLLDAQKDDKPRWGDYAEKLDLGYIANLVNKGEWFDNSQPFFLVEHTSEDKYYAPSYVLRNQHRFQYILTRNSRETSNHL